MRYFRVHDCRRACFPSQKIASRPYGATPLLCCPFQAAATLRVADIIGEVRYAGVLRPPCSVHSVTAIPNRGSGSAVRTTEFLEIGYVFRAELVADVGMSCLLARDCWTACSPGRGRDSSPYGTVPILRCPRRSGAPLWARCIHGEFPSAGILRPPSLGSSCHSDTQVRNRI